MSTTAKNRLVGFGSTVLSVVAVAGLLWVLPPHPRTYTVAATPAADEPQIAQTENVALAYSREALPPSRR